MKLSVEVYIQKNTLVISDIVQADNTSPFTSILTDLTMTTNQYVGHYVKITSGDSINSISYILSNTTTTLTLQDGIQVFENDTYEIYRSDYQRLDLFDDEKISVTSQIGNANDIGKLYTDYTQSFTIPASKNNNEILSHWYESSIDNGFDHRIRYFGYIEVNTHKFKEGTIQLEKADKKDGFIQSYSITFYGNLVQLKDVFKDAKLQSLNFSSFNHTYNSNEVLGRIGFATPNFEIRYPLIGNANKYTYQDGSSTDITTSSGAIKWNELFPAISVKNIFARMQAEYGVTFTGSFFSLTQWTKLYLYLKPSLAVNFISEPETINFSSYVINPSFVAFPELNLASDTLTTNWNFPNYGNSQYYRIMIRITPAGGFTTIPYVLYVYKDGNLFSTIERTGVQDIQADLVRRRNDPTLSHRYNFKIAVKGGPFTYTAQITYNRVFFSYSIIVPNNNWIYKNSRAITTSTSSPIKINIANYMPDIKIVDFLTGIIKAFNLMIIPRLNNTYEFLPLEMYYNAGKVLDITEYTYENEMSINKPKLFKSINFKYEESKNVLNEAYKGLYQQSYGDLIYTSDRITENSTYDIKLPFENVLFEVPTQGKLFQTATLIDKDLKPYVPKPMLIYLNGVVPQLTGNDRIWFTQGFGSPNIQLGNYHRFSNEYDNFPTDPNHSQLMTMNFGNEQSSWLNELAPQGLYFRHYKNFIDNLYNIKTRLIKAKALLPASLLGSTVTNGAGIPLGIALNDRLIIRNKRYLINSFTTDLTTGEANLELLTDYRGVNAVNSVGYRFASFETIDTDKEELNTTIEIYLNDYDYFNVKGNIDFLVYGTSSNNTQDIPLEVTILQNTTGLDRSTIIIIEYYINGVMELEESIIVSQTAI
jgi:hypothetical protein